MFFSKSLTSNLKITILLPTVLKWRGKSCFENAHSCFDDEYLSAFYRENCSNCENFVELKEAIASAEVKHNARIKITRFTLQIYAFVFQRLMDFPIVGSRFAEFETFTTLNLLEHVHQIINVKIHLYHSHVTGKIHGCAQDFCSIQLRENRKMQFSCIAHNCFGFDMFFLPKGIQLSVWLTQDLSIGGSGLSNINFDSLGSQFKFIDTMKYYPINLGKLTSTLDSVEKKRVEKLVIQFLNQYEYFSQIWQCEDKRKILDIIVREKGVILYEKIKTMDSLSLQPQNGIFLHKMNFIALKVCTVNDLEYNNSKCSISIDL